MSEATTAQGEGEKKRVPEIRRTALFLIEAGWWPAMRGFWRHRSCAWPWPTFMAVRVTREAENGGNEWIHRALRGEMVDG